MQTVTLHALPCEEPWSVEEFIEHTEDACRHAAIVRVFSIAFCNV
jgi:hypothetical protein